MKISLRSLQRLKPVRIVKKNLPEIMIVVGIGGVVFSAVDACRQTLKLGDALDEIKGDISSVHERKAITNEEEYPEKDIRKDLTVAYVKGGASIAKLYSRPVIVGALSIGSILGGTHIYRKRNFALLATCTAIETSYQQYRMRVKEKLGEDAERKLYFGVEQQEYEETTTGKDGKEKTKKKKADVLDPTKLSPYTFIFDESSSAWDRDAEYNKMFLLGTQNHANDKLNIDGYLFLNDVLEWLGLPKTKTGQVVGWLKDGDGDGFVDFGIFDINDWKKRDFVNGYERSIILDFNVDGVILDKI